VADDLNWQPYDAALEELEAAEQAEKKAVVTGKMNTRRLTSRSICLKKNAYSDPERSCWICGADGAIAIHSFALVTLRRLSLFDWTQNAGAD
jgi:hypothetical protein